MARIVMKVITKIPEEWKPTKNPNLIIRNEEEGILIISDKENIFPIVLNKVSARIFNLCNGERTVSEIISIILRDFVYNNKESVREDVLSCIARLKFLKFII